MNTLSKHLLTAIVVTLTLSATGCANNGTDQDSTKRIGYVVTTLSNPYFVDMTEAAADEATNYENVEVVIQSPDQAVDIEDQIQIIENLVTQGVDAICVVPADSRSIVSAVARANTAGIPVLIIDNRMDEGLAAERSVRAETFIGSNNYEGGFIAGEHIAGRINQAGEVAVLEGVSGVDAAIQRKSGFADAIGQYPNIEIVASQTANWSREQGLNVFQNMLQSHPEIDALFASNDEMALGAIQAIREEGREGEIIVVGFDATDDGLDAVEGGRMEGSVAQLPALMGRLAVQKAISLLEGASIEAEIPIPVQLITTNDLRRAPADSVLQAKADSLIRVMADDESQQIAQ